MVDLRSDTVTQPTEGMREAMSKAVLTLNGFLDSLRDMGRTWIAWMTGSFLGFFVGILPAAGATPGSLMAYGVARMTSKDSDNFGK